MPYWANNLTASHEKVKVSYYEYTDISGSKQLLAFIVNISSQSLENISVKFDKSLTHITDAETGKTADSNFNMEPYDYKILFVK